jgi:hypothetical protein
LADQPKGRFKWLLIIVSAALVAANLGLGNYIMALAFGWLTLAVVRTMGDTQRDLLSPFEDWRFAGLSLVAICLGLLLSESINTQVSRISIFVGAAAFIAASFFALGRSTDDGTR